MIQSYHRAVAGLSMPEGGISDAQAEFLSHFVREHAISRVVQTGFGLGKSAWAFLAANADVSVVSFDLGEHADARTAAEIIRKRFPHRHVIHWGDSKRSIPQVLKEGFFQNGHPDLVFIDGGHDYETARADLWNLASEGAYVIADDLLDEIGAEGVRRAWEEAKAELLVKEHARYRDGVHHQWAAGRYWRGSFRGRVSRSCPNS